MTLPEDFHFSQGSLQDYVDCPRRFQLRYLQHVAWPAVPSEPFLEYERRRRMGEIFHRLAHQYALGLPEDRLSRMALHSRLGGTELDSWWQNFLSSSLIRSFHPANRISLEAQNGPAQGRIFPEISLSGPLCGATLTAKYDALYVARGDGDCHITILDWKTDRRRQKRSFLSSRLQTRVYQFLIGSAGAGLNAGSPLDPDRIEMIYWFAGFPDDPERFSYSPAQFGTDAAYISALIQSIRNADESEYPSCTNLRLCMYCIYRSLCVRGVRPGNISEEGDEAASARSSEPGTSFDFDQINEIEF